MTTSDRQFTEIHSIRAVPEDASTEALASVRAELLAIPREAVRRPYGVDHLTTAVLASVQAARPAATREEEAHLSRLEVLARPLLRARREVRYERARHFVADLDQQFAAAERKFVEIDELVDVLARRREIARRDVPPVPRREPGWSEGKQRCELILAVTEFLCDHDGGDPYRLRVLHEAERLAHTLSRAETEVPGRIPATELRDRAYTALRQALDAQGSAATATERSGELFIAGLRGAHSLAIAI